MVSLVFCGKLLLLLLLPVSSLGRDPCHSYSELNNPYRSIAYVAAVGVDTMICDEDVISGWYRFVNEVGGEMPEFKADIYHCGTVAPIWMQGSHPSVADGEVNRTACVNFNNMFGGCLSFWGTQRIVSVNYLFGRPLIPSDFLETIVTLNFRDMRNLMSVAFGLSKLSFLVPKKGQLLFSERREDLKFSGLDKKTLINSRILKFP